MNELKQILTWGICSLFGLVALPLLIFIACNCGINSCLLTYVGIAYLLILLTVVALLVICTAGAQRRLNQEKEHELQQKAIEDKFKRESERINAKAALDKEERDRKWKLEDEDKDRKLQTAAETSIDKVESKNEEKTVVTEKSKLKDIFELCKEITNDETALNISKLDEIIGLWKKLQ